MTQQQPPTILMKRNGVLAFLVTVLIAYSQWLSYHIHTLGSLRSVALLGLGVVYLGLGIASIQIDIPGTRSQLVGYCIIQITLGFLIIYLGQSTTWLVIFPLVSQVVIMLPRRDAWLVNIAIFVGMLVLMGLMDKGNLNLQLVFGILCGMVFVILFSQIVVSEQISRHEVLRLNNELSEANRKLHEYALQVEELAIMQERNRLARDIHDGLGHYLTALNMQIKAAQAVMEQDPARALDALTKAQVLTVDALSDVRRSVAALRGEPTLSQPLTEALDELVSECRVEGLVAVFTVKGRSRTLASQVDLTFYRAAQEALTNVRKHALASRVDVILVYEENRVLLSIRDNGVGANNLSGGFGIFGLRERVSLLNGRVDIRTAPQQGFLVDVELPG
jgi:signal transduction histidine kinase